MDSAGIKLSLVGFLFIKTQHSHTKENWKINLFYCVLSKYPHLCSPILVSFSWFQVIWMFSASSCLRFSSPSNFNVVPGKLALRSSRPGERSTRQPLSRESSGYPACCIRSIFQSRLFLSQPETSRRVKNGNVLRWHI